MDPNWAAATANARRIMHVEDVLSLGWEQPLQHFFITTLPGVVQAMNVFYFLGHFVLTGAFFVWLYWTSRPAFRRFRDGFLVATGISVVVHWLYPTAPPRVAVASIIDTLWFFDGIDMGSPSSDALSNPVAAVPSLHAGYAVRRRRRPRPVRERALAAGARRPVPVRRDPHDHRDRQPLRARRDRGDGRHGRRLPARRLGAPPPRGASAETPPAALRTRGLNGCFRSAAVLSRRTRGVAVRYRRPKKV